MWSLLVLVAAVAPPFLPAPRDRALCSVTELRANTGYRYRTERIREFVDSATLIVRAVAIGIDSAGASPATPPQVRVYEFPIRFRVVETLRGPVLDDRLVLPGILVDRDDFNPNPVPYTIVRPSGQRGDCAEKDYRAGAEYLFILRPSRVDGSLTPYWRSLAPFNEQVRGADDPWVEWVRAQVRSQSGSRRGA